MIRYILTRVGAGIATVYFIATATFMAMHFVPGDPISGAKAMHPEIRANLERKYGLDQPVSKQYVIYLTNMLRETLGSPTHSRIGR